MLTRDHVKFVNMSFLSFPYWFERHSISFTMTIAITIINNLLVQKDPHGSLPLDKRVLLRPPKNLQMIHNRTLPSTITQPKLCLFTTPQMLFRPIMRNKNLTILFPISIRPLSRVHNPVIAMISFSFTSISGDFLLTAQWWFSMVGMEVETGSSVCETDLCSEWDFGTWFAWILGVSFFDDP